MGFIPMGAFAKEISVKPVSVGHVVGCMDPRTGGPAYSEENLCIHLQKRQIQPVIFSFHYPYDDREKKWETIKVHSLSYNPLRRWMAGWNPQAFKEFCAAVKEEKISLIHNQGLWLFPNLYARLCAQKFQLPLITSVRGMLEPWALKKNALKKKIAWFLYEKNNLESVNVFHATSELEAESIRQMGFRQPIAVIPNGMNIATKAFQDTCSYFKELKNKRILLFLSRIDPKKGLERLLEVWQELSPKYSEWHLVIAGSGDEAYVQSLKEKAKQKLLQNKILWTGFVDGEYKQELWKRAQLSILPSFSENFGNVVIEALSHAVPVITTQGTPWKELSDYQCGWWAENSQEAIEKALREALIKSPEELRQMGQRGFEHVRSQYDWNEIAEKMTATYDWMLGQGEKPAHVRMN
jgi:glycosyltransferase involved in cell wall biosynthesis